MSDNGDLTFTSADMLLEIVPELLPVEFEPVNHAMTDREPEPTGLDPVDHALIDQLMSSEQLGEVGTTAQKYIRNVRLQRDFGAFMIGSVERAIATTMAEVAEAAAAVADAKNTITEATAKLIEVTTAIREGTVTMTAATARLNEATTAIGDATMAFTAATAASARASDELVEGLATLDWMRRGMSVQDGESKTESKEFSVFDVLHG